MHVKWNRHLDGLPRQKSYSTINTNSRLLNNSKKSFSREEKSKEGNKDSYFFKLFKVKNKEKTLPCNEETRKAFSLGPEFRGARNGSEYIGKRLQYHSCLLSSPVLPNESSASLHKSIFLNGKASNIEEEICLATGRRAVLDRRKCGYQLWRRQDWFTTLSFPRKYDTYLGTSLSVQHHSNLSPSSSDVENVETHYSASELLSISKPSDDDSACEMWDKCSSSPSAAGLMCKDLMYSKNITLAKNSARECERQHTHCIASKQQTNLKNKQNFILNKGGRLLPAHRSVTGPEPKKSTWVSKAELTQEIQHLGALCESRTKELNMLKMQLKHAALGFEAFGVLSQYLTEELDAFSHPKFVAELHRTQQELNKAGSQLQFYQKQLEELKVSHAHEIIVLTEKLGQAHREEIDALKKRQKEELAEVEALHKDQVASLKNNLISALEEVEKKHADVLKELNNDYQKHKEEMQRMHAQQLEETQHTHKETEASLCKKLEELQKHYDILQQQAKQAEEAFLRDKNSKTQWIKSKKSDLEKEVESLKTVLEMKSTEIHALRRENLEMKKELEELPKAKDTIRKLEAKKEDLQAVIKEKICAQGQITSEHHQLTKELEKESKVKERLSMENEALQWRLQQSMEASYILQSLAASQDLRDEFAREGYVKIPHRSRCSLPVLFGDTDMDRSEMFPSDIMSVSVPSFTPSPKRSDRSTSFTASWHPTLSTQGEPAFYSPISESRRPRSASERPFLSGSTKNYLKRTSQNFRHIPKKEKESFKREDSVLNTLRLGRQKLNIPLEKMEDLNDNNPPVSVVDVDEQDNKGETSSDSSGIIQEVLEYLVSSCEKGNKSCIGKENCEQKREAVCHMNKVPYDILPVTGDKSLTDKLCPVSEIKQPPPCSENKKINRDEFVNITTNTLQREEWTAECTEIDASSQSEIFRQVQETISPELSEAEQDVIACVREVDVQEGSLVSTSLQSSLNSSDDSSWSIPLQHATQHSVSPGEDSSSSYSSKSQEGGSLAEHSDKSSCGDVMGPSEDRHYISSPRSLAGEAMILDDSTASHGHAHRFFLDVSCDLLTGPLDEMECRDISSSPEEIKGKIVNHICSETPSMETSSQGMLLTDSTNMDVSWGEDEMPSEADV